MFTIKKIISREIIDSRAEPTIETILELKDGAIGIFSVPSGASTGKSEALELRDNDAKRFNGKGVLVALQNIANLIAPALIDKPFQELADVDNLMTSLDGTQNRSKFGANSILSVSGSLAKALANSQKIPLYQFISQLLGRTVNEFMIPTPMFNILNGGKHGGGNLDFQEFLVVPPNSNSYSKDLKLGVEVYHTLKEVLHLRSATTLIGDEGGFAPSLYSNTDAFKVLQEAVSKAGYNVGLDAFFSIDVASENIKKGTNYRLKDKPVPLTAQDLYDFYIGLNEQYPLLSIEDPFSEEDRDQWTKLTQSLGGKILIVADDLTATHKHLLEKAVSAKAANAVVVKPNQVGTISETIDFVKTAKDADFKIVASHRSGETNDDFIADFAVGIASDYCKLGAPARGERVAKYNRLLEIEHELS